MVSALCAERVRTASDRGRSPTELLELFPFLSTWEGLEELSEHWSEADDTAWRQRRVPAFLAPRLKGFRRGLWPLARFGPDFRWIFGATPPKDR